jgi:murein DD-endopeptidase MepM/ murein hydrolase activator NlpD
MSRRSSHSHYSDYSGHRGDTRAHPAAAATRGGARRDYTFTHAGRQVRLGPVAFWVVVGTLVIMALWTITTGTYFAFRDDVLTRLIARQANMQFGYEDRIAELRAQIDRISSRQLLDQELYEQKLEQILQRQATLESRASAVGGIPDMTTTGSIKPTGKKGDAARSKPTNDKGAFLLQSTQTVMLPSRTAKSAGSFDDKLAHLQASLDRVEQRQGMTLSSLEERLEYKARRIRGVLVDLGLEKGKSKHAEFKIAGVGGPFLPLKSGSEAGGFDRQLSRIKLARSDIERLTRTLSSLPVRKPLSGELEVASGFGVRSDPFTRSAAMHTGLDFQSESGAPVRATANGTVTTAGWKGGYGKMVDVDHGNGYSTRYGHLSAIEVKDGQTVRAGQIIGRVGSTGRSTWPHLHYETRIGRDAVDPEKFLRAGAKLEGHL